MIKILSVVLSLVLSLLCLSGCNKNEIGDSDSKITSTQNVAKEQNEKYYTVSTEWMDFYLSKKDFSEADVIDIVNEAVLLMADVRSYLDLNYTLNEAEDSACYFDSTYKNNNGENRSMCFTEEKIIYCISLDSLVHEYVHLISGNNADLVYSPSDVLIEGLAEYVSLNFYSEIASQNYIFFKERVVLKSSDLTEDRLICQLLTENRLEYNASNYTKAFVAMLCRDYGLSKINKDADYYKYSVGYVLADYCINQYLGLERFIDVYTDSITFVDVYGKSIDTLVEDACVHNISLFYKV